MSSELDQSILQQLQNAIEDHKKALENINKIMKKLCIKPKKRTKHTFGHEKYLPLKTWLNRNVDFDANAVLPNAVLVKAIKEYNLGLPLISVARYLGTYGIKPYNRNGVRGWLGIKLNNETNTIITDNNIG